MNISQDLDILFHHFLTSRDKKQHTEKTIDNPSHGYVIISLQNLSFKKCLFYFFFFQMFFISRCPLLIHITIDSNIKFSGRSEQLCIFMEIKIRITFETLD